MREFVTIWAILVMGKSERCTTVAAQGPCRRQSSAPSPYPAEDGDPKAVTRLVGQLFPPACPALLDHRRLRQFLPPHPLNDGHVMPAVPRGTYNAAELSLTRWRRSSSGTVITCYRLLSVKYPAWARQCQETSGGEERSLLMWMIIKGPVDYVTLN